MTSEKRMEFNFEDVFELVGTVPVKIQEKSDLSIHFSKLSLLPAPPQKIIFTIFNPFHSVYSFISHFDLNIPKFAHRLFFFFYQTRTWCIPQILSLRNNSLKKIHSIHSYDLSSLVFNLSTSPEIAFSVILRFTWLSLYSILIYSFKNFGSLQSHPKHPYLSLKTSTCFHWKIGTCLANRKMSAI